MYRALVICEHKFRQHNIHKSRYPKEKGKTEKKLKNR